MRSLRTFFRDHRRLAALLVALTLSMKALVPSGYMIGATSRLLTVEICADSTGQHLTRQIAVPLSGKPGESQDEHGKGDGACPHSAVSKAALSGADAPLLAIVLAFLIVLCFASVTPAPVDRRSYLRPPLRGPPAVA